MTTKQIPGVLMTLVANGESEIQLGTPEDPEGIGRIKARQLELAIWIDAKAKVFAYRVDGENNVVPPKNLSSDVTVVKHLTRMQVHGDRRGVAHTRYPENHIRFLHVTTGGEATFWESCIISQDGNFFWTSERTKVVQLLRDGDKVICPLMSEWAEFGEYITAQFASRAKFFPTADTAPVVQEIEPVPPTRPNVGVVRWWHAARGIGSIVTSQGIARVHWSQIIPPSVGRRAFLRRGESVLFSGLRSPVQGRNGTSFQIEAVGVKMNAE